jgi:hypothetical protein
MGMDTCPGGPGEDWRKIEQMFVRGPGPKNRLSTIFRSGPGDVPNFGEKSHRVTGAKMGRLFPWILQHGKKDRGRAESLVPVV